MSEVLNTIHFTLDWGRLQPDKAMRLGGLLTLRSLAHKDDIHDLEKRILDLLDRECSTDIEMYNALVREGIGVNQ